MGAMDRQSFTVKIPYIFLTKNTIVCILYAEEIFYMPLLQVRNFPEGLYTQIGMAAEREHRTIAQQTIVLLEKSLGQAESNKERRNRALEESRSRIIPEAAKAIDVAKLVREDRER
jgi:hypothetical protein